MTTLKTSAFFILMAILLTVVPVSVYAGNGSNIMPRWDNVGNVSSSLVFYSEKGEAIASVTRGSVAT